MEFRFTLEQQAFRLEVREFFKGALGGGHVPTDLWMQTPVRGLFAAGDIRQSSAAQLASSAGDGATAAIAARRYIEGRAWAKSQS